MEEGELLNQINEKMAQKSQEMIPDSFEGPLDTEVEIMSDQIVRTARFVLKYGGSELNLDVIVRGKLESWIKTKKTDLEHCRYTELMVELGRKPLDRSEFISGYTTSLTPIIRFREIIEKGIQAGAQVRNVRTGEIFRLRTLSRDCLLILEDHNGSVLPGKVNIKDYRAI